MEAQGQQPAAESIVHELAKPAMKALAWTACLVGLAALGAAAIRNVQVG